MKTISFKDLTDEQKRMAIALHHANELEEHTHCEARGAYFSP